MATNTPNFQSPSSGPSIRTIHLVAILAILAPVGYLIGRFSAAALTDTYFSIISPVVVATSFGVMAGIPIGLFFGSVKAAPLRGFVALPATQTDSGTLKHEPELLAQIRQELSQVLALFKARRGDQTVLARIAYPTELWDSIKASGQLIALSNPKLLTTIATAYYWVGQANHLETMAFEARYSPVIIDNQNASTHLVAGARLLDGPLETSLNAALASIDVARDEAAKAAAAASQPAKR